MVPFRKMHGLGNDFVVLDGRNRPIRLTEAGAAALAHRRLGIGCDQVIMIASPEGAGDAWMRIWNADGHEVESCGNAARCVAAILMDETGRERVKIETQGGLLVATPAEPGADGARRMTVDMGAPRFEWDRIPLDERMDTRGIDLQVGPIDDPYLRRPSAVNVGNPHCVFFVENVDGVNVAQVGPLVENHMRFPERANVSFVEVHDRGHARVRVWERGVGMTRACGTAACAVVAAGARTGKDLLDRSVAVELDGGILDIEWRETDNRIYMTGPTVDVFAGEFDESLITAAAPGQTAARGAA